LTFSRGARSSPSATPMATPGRCSNCRRDRRTLPAAQARPVAPGCEARSSARHVVCHCKGLFSLDPEISIASLSAGRRPDLTASSSRPHGRTFRRKRPGDGVTPERYRPGAGFVFHASYRRFHLLQIRSHKGCGGSVPGHCGTAVRLHRRTAGSARQHL
jgi:hypothetical protein